MNTFKDSEYYTYGILTLLSFHLFEGFEVMGFLDKGVVVV